MISAGLKKAWSEFFNVYYPDIPIFLVLIPLISAFNYYLTYSSIELDAFFFITYSIDTVQGYVVWLLIRRMIIFYDRIYPYERNEWIRIGFQVISTTFVGVLFLGSTTELLTRIVRGTSAPKDFFTTDLVIISIWFFVINGIYVGIFFYRRWSTIEGNIRLQEGLNSLSFISKIGGQLIKISASEIVLFIVSNEMVAAVDQTGKKYFLEQTLSEIDDQLNPRQFFRLNRQCIAHHSVIRGFRRIENGKVEVEFTSEQLSAQRVTVSRTKAPKFKQWFAKVQ